MRTMLLAIGLVSVSLAALASAADGNRLVYLDEFCDPYYVERDFPVLVAPQWVGEDGVEAVVVLAIDDMRGHEKWEAFLRPILERLKQIDGRAALSIMTNQIDPADPHLQKWLAEGLSLEVHTIDHPCPCLKGGDFDKAKSTFEQCVDLLDSVPRNRAVAFRMPCCDSINSVSPRFFMEIFNRATPAGNFLTLDSSVFLLFTPNDPAIPEELVLDRQGQERFRKYAPFRSFVNTIEDYPYPYVIGRLCWEFPGVVPTDWSADHLQKANNPATVDDWCAALDACVLKQGTFNLVFHPHGWIRNDQIVQLVDHAVQTHGSKVKFLNFREAQEHLNEHLLAGQPLRAANGQDNGVRLLDLNGDGYLDVVIGNENLRRTRLWSPDKRQWIDGDFPVPLVTVDADGQRHDAGVRFGVFGSDGFASFIVRNETTSGAWRFDGRKWVADPTLLAGLEIDGKPVFTSREGRDQGVRLRDLDRDGRCEAIVANPRQQAVFTWNAGAHAWRRVPCNWPEKVAIVDAAGRDAGLRFVDVDGDGYDDLLFSNEQSYSLNLFSSLEQGWSRPVLAGSHPDPQAIPMIARAGTNNGAWFSRRHLWLQNEDTDRLPDGVDRRSFNELLGDAQVGPLSPQAALKSMHVRPGFAVELVAAEPLVMDPVAFDWGPDGKLWVVEMADYPLGIDGKGTPGGRVRYLEDTDGDGKYVKSTLFLDGLNYPTGVMAWGKGVLVSAAPEIFYAEDTDGDGKADRRVTLFQGFGEGNQQHRVNGFRWGLDNWVYLANGDSGGQVKSLKTGEQVDIGGRDLRIRPDEGLIDAEIGPSQFGRDRDDWQNWFGCNNSVPKWHFVLTDRCLRRNAHIAPPESRVDVSATPGAAPVFPVSRTLARFNEPGQANHFTSANSTMVFRDEHWGPEYLGNSFVSEPVHNLVHREVMTARGVTFASRRADDEQQSEFLASTDNWFRPTTIRTGPDGALWIADMYRQVIEHPEWIPADWQKRLDLRAGHDKGRIYRVYPVHHPPRPIPRLDKLDTAGLVAALDSPNGPQRDMSQQLILWRNDRQTIAPLLKLAADSPRALARLHALCTLNGLGALDAKTVARALADEHPGVRRHAVRLAEARLAKSPYFSAALPKLVDDPDPQVQLQLAYTLGEWRSHRAGRALGQLVLANRDDVFLSAAAMSSVNESNVAKVLAVVLSADDPPQRLVEQLMSVATALGNRPALGEVFKLIARPQRGRFDAWQMSALAGVLDTLGRHGEALDKRLGKAAVRSVDAMLTQARRTVVAEDADEADQLIAVRVLGCLPHAESADVALLGLLLTPRRSAELQTAVVAALARIDHRDVPAALFVGWKSYTPDLRSQVLDALASRDDWATALIDQIELGAVEAAHIDAARRQRLLTYRTAAVRQRAEKLFSGANSSRQAVIDQHADVLKLKGDAERGRAVFAKRCATCHRLDNQGFAVGADLAAVGDKSPQALLIAILDPSRAVEDRYVDYLATTTDGRQFTGILASETGNSITLKGQEGKEQVILRGDLEQLRSSGKSLMPEGLEKDLSPQDLADVIAYVGASGPPPKPFPGNQPELVRASADGVLVLSAANCKIFGSSLVFEQQYRNLGFWQSTDDHAVWSLQVARSGKYRVLLDYACDNSVAGNQFVLKVAGRQLAGKVPGTGTWDDYRELEIGTLELPEGESQADFRSLETLNNCLLDLRAIKILPE